MTLDHEDDIDHSSEDEETNEVDVTTTLMAKEATTIPNWNVIGEPDLVLMNSWQTWNGIDLIPNQDEYASGQIFNSLEELKRKITIYSVAKGKEYKVEKARNRWYTVVCVEKDKGCTWRLSANKICENDDMWKISMYRGPDVPSCVRNVMHMDNRNIHEKFIVGPSLTPSSPYSDYSTVLGSSFASLPYSDYPMVFGPSSKPLPYSSFQGFSRYGGYSSAAPSSFSEFGDYSWTSPSSSSFPTSPFYSNTPNLFASTDAQGVFISLTRPMSRDVMQKRSGFDPSLSCVREPNEDEEEEEEDEDEEEDKEDDDEDDDE